jgi:putative ABC transport system permease protein
MLGWSAFVMPRRFLRGGLVRIALTVLAVAAGVALVCAIDLVNRAVYAAFVDVLDGMAGRASLVVSAGDGAAISESVANVVHDVAGVELAVPVVSSWAFTTDAAGEQLTVHGIDVANDDAIRVYEPAGSSPALDDPIVFLNHRDSVVLTDAFAARHGLVLDDPIELETPTGRHRFVVRGLLAPTGIARVQGGNLVVMDIAAAELAFTQRGLVSRIDVVVRPDADLGVVRDAIMAALPAGLRVEAPEARRLDLQRLLRSVQTMLQAVGVFGLFAAFLIAYSRLSTVFAERVGQLAVLRAVGVRSRRVWWELVKESALIAVAGIALGVPAGILLGHALLPVIATTTAIGANLETAEAVVTVRPESVVLAGLLGLAAVLLAAVLPARRAARVPVVETLRHQHVDTDAPIGSLRLGLGLVAPTVVLTGIHLATGSAAVGLAASAAIVVSAAVFTRPLLDLLARPLGRLGPRLGGAVGRFAVANLLCLPRRTALTIATLGVGLGTVLWLWTLAGSFEQSVLEVMPGVLRGDFAVSSANIGTGYVEAPLDEAILGPLAAVAGVAAVVGEQAANWHYAGGPIALNCFDPSYFAERTFGDWRWIGRTFPNATQVLAGGEGVIVSENFVHNIGSGVGDILTLDTPSGPVGLRVVGVVADFLSPRGTVLLSRDLYRRLWSDTHVTHVLVRVAPAASADAVRATIERTLGRSHHIRVLRLPELVDWFAEQVRRAFTALDVLASLVIVVVLVGVSDALAAGMLERTRELGVARAIGVPRRTLGRVVVWEAVLLAVLGVVLATILGLGLGVLWVKATFPALLGWTLALHLPLAQTAELALASVAICLLAAYLPAARAVRLDPVAALRAE